MKPSLAQLSEDAARELESFRQRIVGVPYERKGVLYSEMLFLFLCAREVGPRRILESGRARGQSTLLLARLFPGLPIISFEHDPDSPDVPVAQERLKNCSNVDLRFGDAMRMLPAEVQKGDIVLIDGPKGFRGLRLAITLLATKNPSLVFVHDCGVGSAERAFLDTRVPSGLYSDLVEFARVAHVLDDQCQEYLPEERRFANGRAPIAYGYGLACLPFDPSVSYRMLYVRAMWDGFVHRHFKRGSAGD